jgi:hypothetical protein
MFRTAIASHGHSVRKPRCDARTEQLEIQFDFNNFQCEFPHVMQYHHNLLALGEAVKSRHNATRVVMYEDLKRDTASTYNKILEFIGVRHRWKVLGRQVV